MTKALLLYMVVDTGYCYLSFHTGSVYYLFLFRTFSSYNASSITLKTESKTTCV